MKFQGTKVSLGLVLSGALLLGACTSPEPTDPEDAASGSASATASASEGAGGGDAAAGCLQDVGITETADGEVRFTAGPGDWSGYNTITNGTYSTYNSVIAAHMFSNFVYFGTDGTICDNTDFGTYEVTSEDPLTVEYTINEEAVWSDGTPVTINDYLMDWAAQNPEFIAPGFATGEDPEAAVFDHVSTSFAQYVLEGPEGEVGSKNFTVVYTNPNPDYRIMVTAPLPEHVLAAQAGLEPGALAQAVIDRDAETVKSAAEFWNTGWIFNPGELPEASVTPSSGPYMIKEGGWQAGNSLTLTANEDYWGTPAATRDLVFRFIDDAQQVQALGNKDVQVIQPQATVDTVGQLEALGSAVSIESGSSLTWEHLDFNFRENNVFGNPDTGLTLRTAFAHCVPRQQIVDTLIAPIAPDTVLMNAREVFPFQDNYDEIVGVSYDGRFDTVDLEKSKELVAEAGIATPIDVRLGYRAGNQRRTETVAAIQSSCKEAGFNVIDSSAEDFFTNANVNGDYEVALFAWAGSGQITSGENIYATAKPQNTSEFSSEIVDAAWAELVATLDETVHLEQTKIIEKELWDQLHGIPLYAHPLVVAYDSTLSNVRATATQDQVSWNAPQWVAK
ncbi:ABC transporter family substrate-binding protein [Tessaracoccus sp. MC1627]|uniref:ABC transporter substrate-binding protein n=1 Tax=Tessaracoccus sp. MC1627 TaxID=2760312 RepID=UPI0016042149|nr:ABC transporter substrate-binding protein [Tessaracoccus sp. MC1627]MBB1514104.1 ABC transporter family substrate-binding protein [Tessaracoccus sp. MC1627]